MTSKKVFMWLIESMFNQRLKKNKYKTQVYDRDNAVYNIKENKLRWELLRGHSFLYIFDSNTEKWKKKNNTCTQIKFQSFFNGSKWKQYHIKMIDMKSIFW